MASMFPRLGPWLRQFSLVRPCRSSNTYNLQHRAISCTPISCAAPRGRGQAKPRDSVRRSTNRPFNKSDYNDRIPGRDLPEGWRGGGGRSAAARGAGSNSNRRPARREYDDDEDDDDEEDEGDEDEDEVYERNASPRINPDPDLLPYEQRLQYRADIGEGLIDEDDTEPSEYPLDEEQALKDEDMADDDESERYFTTDLETRMSKEKRSDGLFDGLDDEMPEVGHEPEFQPDDIMSNAHGELEQHRELREFYRLIAWDMPLLWDHQKPFQSPSAATPLRFRYTTYLGETHPAEKKVVCTFDPHAIPDLTEQQADKLLKLLGPRYDSVKKEAKMSCELHHTMAQNKRYIGDLLDKLIDEAKNGEDTFEDVPLDLRHMRKRMEKERKRQIAFPEEWKMTEERRAQLQEQWALSERRQQEAIEQGTIVQGAGLQHQIPAPGQQAEAVMATQPARPGPRARTTLR